MKLCFFDNIISCSCQSSIVDRLKWYNILQIGDTQKLIQVGVDKMNDYKTSECLINKWKLLNFVITNPVAILEASYLRELIFSSSSSYENQN